MKINNINEVEGFLSAVQQCKGKVYLRSLMGDVYNLKSELSQYIAIGKLLGEHGEELELFCDDKSDEAIFFKYFKTFPDVV